jgi:NTE family protein
MDRIARDAARAMRTASHYATWREAARRLDEREGLDDWKADDRSDDFDWRLIRSKLEMIREYRATGQTARLVFDLRQGLYGNLGNIGDPRLYGVAHFGTKRVIEDYIAEVCIALEEICEAPDDVFPLADKRLFFDKVAQSFGRSSLMLSGGATLGLFHVGVAKALFEEGLLPTVLSGSSAGSVVAATIGTHRDEDLHDLWDPDTSRFEFWKVLPLRHIARRGALMDQSQLRKTIGTHIRDLTFEEGHQLSGRVINITVSPADLNQAPRLLNHITFPHLYMREAVLASCAVPLLFPPVMLRTRNDLGARVPYMPTLRWNDGSLRSDLPSLRLRRLHNVNHFIVSQTNPHVLPFISRRDPGAQGIRSAVREYANWTLRTQASGLVKLARSSIPLRAVREPLDLIRNVLDQDYRGNINIFPRASVSGFVNAVANPNPATVKRFIVEGERATWPRMEMIRMQTQISVTLERCIARVERLSLDPRQRRPMPAQRELQIVSKRDV